MNKTFFLLFCLILCILQIQIILSQLDTFKPLNCLFIQKKGLEVGGPSGIFSGTSYLPIYDLASSIDGCNFGTQTIWEGEIKEGPFYSYSKEKKCGYQFICEATNLNQINNETYDFIISSHCLEHIANPLKALKEWLRVLTIDGTLLLVLPDKRYTFDKNRPITTFEHIIQDYDINILENDRTHFSEIGQLHEWNTPADKQSFLNNLASEKNEARALHHHIFDEPLIRKIFNLLNIDLIYSDFALPFHMIFVGKKIKG